MLAKLLRGINTLHLAILSVICLCYWVAIRHYSDTMTDESVVLRLAGRQMDSKVHVRPDSKVEQEAPLIKNVVKTTKQNVAKATQVVDSEHQFKEYKSRGVVTLHNLCIENDPSGEQIKVADNVTVTKKILVVYSSTRESVKTIKVAHTENRPNDGHYRIHYHKGNRSELFRYIEDYPAYFTTPSCTANLHHFWADSTEGLYKILKFTNRLGSKVPNQLYYQNPMITTKFNHDCVDIHRYEDILFTLPMRRFHQTYHAEEHGVCYKNAVFGYLTGNDNYRMTVEANHHIFKGMNISYPQCGTGNRVTIIQRHQRRIINLEELMEASRLADYNNTQTVTFEEMKLVDQMRAAYCTDVLVGIQGAGLRWIQYMRPHTAFLEIGWKNWNTKYYKRFGDYQQIKSMTLDVPDRDVHVNWEAYSFQVRQGKVVPEEERVQLLKRKQKDHRDNHWKWADVRIPVDQFTSKLKVLYNYAADSKKT